MEGKKILVTDDNKKILELLEKMLALKGYRVICAGTGKDAILKFRTMVPDLIIMDIMLPDMQGSDVVREIKSLPSGMGVPVIFLSGIAQDDASGGATPIQVDGVMYKAFAKPFEVDKMFREIEKALS